MLETMALLLAFLGCDAQQRSESQLVTEYHVEEAPVRGPPIALTLETRSGEGSQGWSFEREALVPSSTADLVVSAFDCGARGRWVFLESKTVEFCAGDISSCMWSRRIEVGGSSPPISLGSVLHVRRGAESVGRFVLASRSENEEKWYTKPVPPYVVTLEVATR